MVKKKNERKQNKREVNMALTTIKSHKNHKVQKRTYDCDDDESSSSSCIVQSIPLSHDSFFKSKEQSEMFCENIVENIVENYDIATQVDLKVIKTSNAPQKLVNCFLKQLPEFQQFYSEEEWLYISEIVNEYISWKKQNYQGHKFNLKDHVTNLFSKCATSTINRRVLARMIQDHRFFEKIVQSSRAKYQDKKKSLVIGKVYAHRCRNRTLAQRLQVRP